MSVDMNGNSRSSSLCTHRVGGLTAMVEFVLEIGLLYGRVALWMVPLFKRMVVWRGVYFSVEAEGVGTCSFIIPKPLAQDM